jgi:histidine triad (HIT) family protein
MSDSTASARDDARDDIGDGGADRDQRQAGCPFCGIAAGYIPATVVRESERVVAFRDLAPQTPTHVLVAPRAHHRDVATLADAEPQTLVELVSTAAAVAADAGLEGYRLVFNTGEVAGQSVFHVHGHVLGGRQLGALAG